MSGKVKDITGQCFERWTVESFDRVESPHGAYFFCRCECGTVRSVCAKSLKTGSSKSCGCIQKLPVGEAACNSIYRIYRNGAKKRGLDFSLTLEQFKSITRRTCFYCNADPVNCHENRARHYNGPYVYNGVDRKNNKLGYTMRNCVACCADCNMMKRTMTVVRFIALCRRVANCHA
jgi:hypothetical protein